ncbi:tRNA (N6-isopentenyl adenosine(37)-C2)-methylthiotransferase MiaB [bacterium]|nr:MAG: tRNA (N6-isopentenyl adenosine(37)-C2)-methylthiotransferase MiaB [bacterium]
MRYHIWTIGCQMNTADSQRLGSDLERLGYVWTDDADAADVVVLNTCVVRQQAEDKIYGRLGALRPLKAARPDTVVALMGCLVGHKPPPSLRRRFPEVDVFLPPSESRPLVDFLTARAAEDAAREIDREQLAARWTLQDAGPADGALVLPGHERGSLVAAHVPVVYGCNWVCTFCIIPSRRGPERSRPADEIVAHVRSLVEQGVREVTLLGQIVDRYGHDWGASDALPDLLRRLDGVDGLERIRFLTSHPNFMTDRLLDAVAELPKVMEHIEVPVQAGDDTVLARMKRGYTVDGYRRLVDRIRRRIPGVAIHTDIIVGFCGETEAQFQGTYDLLAELRLDKAHIAKYSTRPGTVASKLLVDDVPDDEKERRRKAIDDLQHAVCGAINAAHVGRTVEVLVDGRDKQRWRGRTRTNKLVFFDDPRPLLGRTVEVEITWSGPWSMVGRAAGAPPPRRREVIALAAFGE